MIFLGKYDYEDLKEKLFPAIIVDVLKHEFHYWDFYVDTDIKPLDVNNAITLGYAYTM